MPTPKKGPRFGHSPEHHKHIVANLATELIRHGRIQTTHARAKHVQPLAERMVTLAKRGDLHARRQANQVIRSEDVLHRLFTEVGPANAERAGGYTRVLKLAPRKGDGARMALIELVDGRAAATDEADQDGGRRRWSLRRSRQPDSGGAATAVAEAGEDVAGVASDASDDGGTEPDAGEDVAEAEFAPSHQAGGDAAPLDEDADEDDDKA